MLDTASPDGDADIRLTDTTSLSRAGSTAGPEPRGWRRRTSPVSDADGIACRDPAGTEHAEVGAGRPAAANRLRNPGSFTQAERSVQGDARHPDLDQHAGPPLADAPPFSDDRAGDIEPDRREFLSEEPRRDLSVELSRPPCGILARMCVERLVRTAVVPRVALRVAREAEHAGMAGTIDRSFDDGGRSRWAADDPVHHVDRDEARLGAPHVRPAPPPSASDRPIRRP